MVNKEALSPLEQYQGFARAIETYKRFLESENYIGAYVIAFSILEDRVNAMYATRYAQEKGRPPTAYHIGSQSFVRKVAYLERQRDVDEPAKKRWATASQDRNQKLHAAMWNIDEFQRSDAETILKLAREADRLRKAQKRRL